MYESTMIHEVRGGAARATLETWTDADGVEREWVRSFHAIAGSSAIEQAIAVTNSENTTPFISRVIVYVNGRQLTTRQ